MMSFCLSFRTLWRTSLLVGGLVVLAVLALTASVGPSPLSAPSAGTGLVPIALLGVLVTTLFLGVYRWALSCA